MRLQSGEVAVCFLACWEYDYESSGYVPLPCFFKILGVC
jgi:hypothetical protein